MPIRIRYFLVVLLLLSPRDELFGLGINEIPSECRNLPHTVALIDCLQNQLEILQFALDYHETASKISDLLSTQNPRAPAATEKESSKSEPVLERINWFDQNLEIYAIVGTPEKLTALARLNGRHYRLREGDSVRLATVKTVHSRGVTLTFSEREFSIGLSGSAVSSHKDVNHHDQ